MIQIDLHDVEDFFVTESRDYRNFTARTIRIISKTGNLDVVLYSNDRKTLDIKSVTEEDL